MGLNRKKDLEKINKILKIYQNSEIFEDIVIKYKIHKTSSDYYNSKTSILEDVRISQFEYGLYLEIMFDGFSINYSEQESANHSYRSSFNIVYYKSENDNEELFKNINKALHIYLANPNNIESMSSVYYRFEDPGRNKVISMLNKIALLV